MTFYYLLSVSGQDHAGFVSSVTKILFDLRCNLEDSSMMRLGSEFAMFIIFTSARELTGQHFQSLGETADLSISLKKLSARLARFTPSKKESYIVRVHGQDQPGIVYHVTQCLAKHSFNITDLSTHRTLQGKVAGFIVLLEGELLKKSYLGPLRDDLRRLETRLKTHISIDPVSAQSI